MVAAGLIAGFLTLLSHPVLPYQDMLVPLIDGRVFADRRPVNWLLEVRLEAQSSATIAYAYTLSSSEFHFRNLFLSRNESYFLVIEEPGA